MPDELFDIVDENDQVISQETRSKVHQLGLWHRGAHVLLFTQDDKLIVQQRSKNKSQSPLALDCSVSEHVTAGETYLDAAIRGLKEELGITGITIEPMVKFKMNYGPNDNEISVIFKGTAELEKIRFDPLEIERINAFTLEELQSLLEQKNDTFSYWFEQIFLWFMQKSSALQIMNNR
jgi:16S rRNA (adenine1518-N6/adenine1519-N6)-dimethyltransferase